MIRLTHLEMDSQQQKVKIGRLELKLRKYENAITKLEQNAMHQQKADVNMFKGDEFDYSSDIIAERSSTRWLNEGIESNILLRNKRPERLIPSYFSK